MDDFIVALKTNGDYFSSAIWGIILRCSHIGSSASLSTYVKQPKPETKNKKKYEIQDRPTITNKQNAKRQQQLQTNTRSFARSHIEEATDSEASSPFVMASATFCCWCFLLIQYVNVVKAVLLCSFLLCLASFISLKIQFFLL